MTARSGSRQQPVGPGSFAVKVKLEPGENTLVLLDRKVTVFVPGPASPAPPVFGAPDTHAVDNGCEECHTFKGGAAALVEKPPALCSRCHDDVLLGKDGKIQAVPHSPAQEGDCLACHAFHGLSIKQLPAAAKRELCFGCHDDFTAGGKKRMHRPVAQGECTGCHGAHGAPGKSLLPAVGIKLCLLCHANPSQNKAGADWAVQHPALDDGCPSCHLPHVSEAPRLLKKPAVQLCADCHDPFPAEAGGVKLLQHSPVEEGECAGCHAVHGSDAKKLLVAEGTALCVRCHTDPSLAADGKAWATPHPALDDGCFACHLPHVAPAAGMLKSPQAPLCFGCHDAFVTPGADKGGALHLPVAQGRCSLCHAPHGSTAKKLLLASPARELCLKCHKDPVLDAAGKPWGVPHPALDDGCPTCHAPHVAPAPRLLAKPQAALCAGCHEDKNLNPDGEAWKAPHAPVVAGLCASCHGPHGAPEQSMLKKSLFDICRTCHEEVHERHLGVEIDPATNQPASGKAKLPAGFRVRKGDGAIACVGCHMPHGSDAQRMWNRDESSFCFFCHTSF
jgi:predicted CXXCH cytochrome family protein